MLIAQTAGFAWGGGSAPMAGNNWTARTSSGSRSWQAIVCSSDGQRIAAAVSGGYIYTSADGGATWTERTGAGSRYWYGVASSADMSLIAACANGNYIYTSEG